MAKEEALFIEIYIWLIQKQFLNMYHVWLYHVTTPYSKHTLSAGQGYTCQRAPEQTPGAHENIYEDGN